nr:hypothetical protein 8 [Saccharospirillaceae bacterium]
MSTFGERLREERKRLGINQSEIGRIGGVSKHSQINYENGSRSPTAAYLQAVAASGVDVNYVLTGERPGSGNTVDVQQFEVIGRALDHMLSESNRKLSTQGLVMVAALVYNYLQEEAETDADQETTLHRALKLVVNN